MLIYERKGFLRSWNKVKRLLLVIDFVSNKSNIFNYGMIDIINFDYIV